MTQKSETCRPKITFCLIKLLCLTDTLYFIYIYIDIGITNSKKVVISCQRFGPSYRSHFQGGFPENSARNYHYSLRNNPEEGKSHLFAVEA